MCLLAAGAQCQGGGRCPRPRIMAACFALLCFVLFASRPHMCMVLVKPLLCIIYFTQYLIDYAECKATASAPHSQHCRGQTGAKPGNISM